MPKRARLGLSLRQTPALTVYQQLSHALSSLRCSDGCGTPPRKEPPVPQEFQVPWRCIYAPPTQGSGCRCTPLPGQSPARRCPGRTVSSGEHFPSRAQPRSVLTETKGPSPAPQQTSSAGIARGLPGGLRPGRRCTAAPQRAPAAGPGNRLCPSGRCLRHLVL